MSSIGIARISKKFLWLSSLLCLIWSGMKNVKSSWKKPDFSSRYSMISVSASKSPQTSQVVHPSRFNPVYPTTVNQPKIATIVPSDVSFYLASKRYTAGIFSAKTITLNAGSSKPLPNVTVMVLDNRNSRGNVKIFTAQRIMSTKTRKTSFEASGYAGSILASNGSKNKDSINAESEKAMKFGTTFTSSLKRNFKSTPSDTDKGLTETQFYDDKDKLSFDATKDPLIYLGKKSNTKSPIHVRGKDFIGEKNIKFPPPPQCMFKESSCKGRCGYERQFGKKWTCFCDPECDSIFEDCCADFEEFCNETSILGQNMIESKFEERWICTALHGDDFPVWVIGQCHPEWEDAEVSRKCTEINTLVISELIPVIDQQNNTFLNRYCAICNNVTEFRQWEFEVFCDTIVPAGYTEAQWASFLDFFCFYDSFNLTQTWGRRYCVNVSSNCTYWHNKEIVESCLWQGLTGLITDINSNINYRNWDCFLCNTMRFSQAFCGPRPPIAAPPLTPGVEFGTMPFSSIFRAQSFLIPQSKCPQDQIYDKTFQECKTFLARDKLNLGGILKRYAVILEYKERAKSCGVPLFSGLDGAKLMARLNDVLQKLLEISLMERDSKFMNFKIYSLGNISFHVIFELLENSKEKELLGSSIGYDLKLQNLAFHSQMFSRGVCRYSMNTSIVRKMLCSENGTFLLNEVQFSNKSIFITKTGKCYSFQEYLVLKNGKRLALCKDYWPGNCSFYIEVKKGLNWSIFENGSVHINETKGSWLHYGQYSIVDGVLRVCSSYPKAVFGSATSIHEAILTHATTACLSISIISLTVLFIVYSRFPALRNLPGKNLMLFSVILALGQLLWLLQHYIASLSPRFCVGTTFALQYSVLASFSCSTSIAVHSLLTFHNVAKGSLTQSPSRKKFYYYVLYSLGFPLIILLTCLLLYYHNILNIVHYHPICWFKDDLSVYIAFYIPVLTMLFVNFILLSNTMKLLWNCSNERENLAERNGAPTKMKIGIYLRMSTIMGATWLFGVFILIFPDVVVFEYLFVFFNGLQGLYIALAFLFTDNVKKLIRSRRYDKGTTITQNTSRNKHSTTM